MGDFRGLCSPLKHLERGTLSVVEVVEGEEKCQICFLYSDIEFFEVFGYLDFKKHVFKKKNFGNFFAHNRIIS